MKALTLFFCLLLSPLHATYLVRSNDPTLYSYLMLHDEPRSLFSNQPLTLDHAVWIPSMLWQCAALHLFLKDSSIQKLIKELGLQFNLQDPEEQMPQCKTGTYFSNFDKEVVHVLKKSQKIEEILSIFDWVICHEEFTSLFFAFNHHALDLFHSHGQDYKQMLTAILDDLPCEQFRHLPFIHRGKKDVECLIKALKSKNLMHRLLENEIQAYKENKLVFYRGYQQKGSLLPNPVNERTGFPHALSFGTTLLGGLFFSTDACALRYCFDTDMTPNVFFSLKLSAEQIAGNQSLFRIGPIHPFLQLFCDGEFFHAHTKIPAKSPSDFTGKPLHGYYAACNQAIQDRLGYVFTFDMDLEEFKQALTNLFRDEGCLYSVE